MVVGKPIALMEEQKLHMQIKYTVAWCKREHAHSNVDELKVRILLLLFAVGLSFDSLANSFHPVVECC